MIVENYKSSSGFQSLLEINFGFYSWDLNMHFTIRKNYNQHYCWFNMEFETLRFDMVWRFNIFYIDILK